MKPIYVIPHIKEIDYRSSTLTNNPINISLCESIQKSRLRYYPDNNGIPSLLFLFNKTSDEQSNDRRWNFRSEEDRDFAYDEIMKEFSFNITTTEN